MTNWHFLPNHGEMRVWETSLTPAYNKLME
jgi:hypothetical protein